IIEALDASGKVLAKTESGDPNADPKAGSPFLLPPGTVQIRIDTGKKIQGAFNTKPGGGK
ncbi:MAG: hypothetical protein HZB52_16490, partial [Chloroflexi bacterium]|nr:hypothetical protein [Chloroflexota bacterium]